MHSAPRALAAHISVPRSLVNTARAFEAPKWEHMTHLSSLPVLTSTPVGDGPPHTPLPERILGPL